MFGRLRSYLRFVAVLDDWLEPFAGDYLYYPSRKHASPAFSLVVDALRYRTIARR